MSLLALSVGFPIEFETILLIKLAIFLKVHYAQQAEKVICGIISSQLTAQKAQQSMWSCSF